MNEYALNIPQQLLNSINKSCKIDIEDFSNSHQQNAIISIRHNPFKKSNLFINESKVPWANDAVYLNERIEFIKDPLFHAGSYYVQEASSMFLEQALIQQLDLTKNLKILDLCASPGGKSTLINSLLSNESILVSNEVIKSRVSALAENLTKWGTCNHIVTNNDPKDFNCLRNYFDAIVVDAPCSGSGLFRKQPDVISNWTEQQVEHCSMRQKRILDDILPSLKPGGILIYSTCSFSTEENEEIADWLIEEFNLTGQKIKTKNDWNIISTETKNGGTGYRFFPHLTKGEGFFIAVFKKEDSSSSASNSTKKRKTSATEKVKDYEINTIHQYLKKTNHLRIIKQNEFFFLINELIDDELPELSKLTIRKKGTLLGTFKKNDFIPDHEFALSNFLNNKTNSLELNLEEALQFLKKSDIKPKQQLPLGFIKINHQNKTIGWAKNLGNRINNYLPKEWRILKSLD
jgi:NOL1/NOP2/sun family putative RNA methylase